MAFDRKWLFVILIVLIVVFLIFRGTSKTVQAVTVSNNDLKEKEYADNTDSSPVVLDNDQNDEAPDPAVQNNEIDEEGGHDEDLETDSGETGQSLYMDSEFIDSLVDYLNVSYKLQFIQLVITALLLGSVLALGVMEWFTK